MQDARSLMRDLAAFQRRADRRGQPTQNELRRAVRGLFGGRSPPMRDRVQIDNPPLLPQADSGSIDSYRPGLAQSLGDSVNALARTMGYSPTMANRLRSEASYLPFIGETTDAAGSIDAFALGDWLTGTGLGTLAMVGMVPGVGDAAAAGGRAALRGTRNALRGAPIRAYHGGPHIYAAERRVIMPDGREQFIRGAPDILPEVPQGARVAQDYPLGRFRIDNETIGTGEGAQAYGHGGYFAGNEGVARGYRDNLAVTPQISGRSFNPDGTPNRAGFVAEHLDSRISLPDIEGGLRTLEPDASDEQIAAWLSEGRSIYDEASRAGSMYEVNINTSPDSLLDWDRPLLDQPAAMRETLAGAGALELGDWNTTPWRGYANTPLRGSDVLNRFTTAHGPAGASRALRDAGIPGIRYLDQGSRAAGDGTRNYVIFDDSIIDILRRYGLAGGMVGTGAALAAQEQPGT